AECWWLMAGGPTRNRLAVGSKGSLRLTLRTDGTGGHSAAPVGRSAIDALLAVLADVQAAAWPRDDFFGETTCNIGVIAGGAAGDGTAPDARAGLHFRLATRPGPVRALL